MAMDCACESQSRSTERETADEQSYGLVCSAFAYLIGRDPCDCVRLADINHARVGCELHLHLCPPAHDEKT